MVVDFRGIPVMKAFAPTILDVTHSLQQPNQASGVTGGRPEMIETMARAGIAAGVDGLFMETHFDTKHAKSDSGNMLPLELMEGLLTRLHKLYQAYYRIVIHLQLKNVYFCTTLNFGACSLKHIGVDWY